MINLCARKNPVKNVRSLMEVLETEPLNVHELSKKAGISWVTAARYLDMMEWIQSCPGIRSGSGGKRIKTYRREWGKLPE